MFGIGFFELVVIAVFALIFVGPKKLPDLMRQAGKLFVHMRRAANDVRSTFDQVVREAEDEIRKEKTDLLKGILVSQPVKSIPADHPHDDRHDDRSADDTKSGTEGQNNQPEGAQPRVTQDGRDAKWDQFEGGSKPGAGES